MAKELKTKPSAISPDDYLLAIEDEARRADCELICAMMKKASKLAPTMWGASMIGFDQYSYASASGQKGDWFMVGLSSRKAEMSIYLIAGFESETAQALLAKLGKHKIGKGCLYVKRLADIDVRVLEKLIVHSLKEMRARYPKA